MRTVTKMMASASVLAFVGVAPASAQDIVKLSEFDRSQLENAWSAKQIQDATVYGADGSEVGSVQGVVVGADNKAQKIVVETGGTLEPGGKVIGVPFDQVDLTPGKEGIETPVSQDNVQDFSVFKDPAQAAAGARSFRASEVIGDYVRLSQARDYGYVSDLIFQPDGTLKSVVVAPDVGWESYYAAFPWHGYEYGFEPGADVYELPYAEEEVAEYAGAYENWDYDGLFEGHL